MTTATSTTYTDKDTDDAAHAAALAQGAQERYQAAMDHIQAALHELEAAVLGLPLFPTPDEIRALEQEAEDRDNDELWEHARCDVRLVTEGLAQSSRFDPSANTAYTDGWDDMGDMDGPAYLFDFDCGKAFRPPADMDWN